MGEVCRRADGHIICGHRHKSKEEGKSLKAGGARPLGKARV